MKIPDVKICSVAGVIQAGADCSYTGHSENSEMDFGALVKFLEDGAIMMSAADRLREKNAVESACYLLKDRCTYEIKQVISRMATVEKRKQ